MQIAELSVLRVCASLAFSMILIKKCHAIGNGHAFASILVLVLLIVVIRREMHSSAIKAKLKSITFMARKKCNCVGGLRGRKAWAWPAIKQIMTRAPDKNGKIC